MNFVFLVQKWPFCDTYLLSKKRLETPILKVFWGWALFGARCQNREMLKSHPKKKNLTDNWKAILWYFCCFLGGLLFFFFLSTSLGLKPSLFVFVVLLFCFLFFFWFFKYKKPCFPPRKGHLLFIFSVSLSISPLAFFGLPLFLFLFVCLSLFFFSFFLPSCLSFCFRLVPCFCLFLFFFLLCFSFHERNNIKILNCKLCLHQYFLFFWFPVFFVKFLFLIFAISWF